MVPAVIVTTTTSSAMEFRRRAKLFERNSFLEKIRNRNKPKTDPNCGVMTIKQKDSISKYWNIYYIVFYPIIMDSK